MKKILLTVLVLAMTGFSCAADPFGGYGADSYNAAPEIIAATEKGRCKILTTGDNIQTAYNELKLLSPTEDNQAYIVCYGMTTGPLIADTDFINVYGVDRYSTGITAAGTWVPTGGTTSDTYVSGGVLQVTCRYACFSNMLIVATESVDSYNGLSFVVNNKLGATDGVIEDGTAVSSNHKKFSSATITSFYTGENIMISNRTYPIVYVSGAYAYIYNTDSTLSNTTGVTFNVSQRHVRLEHITFRSTITPPTPGGMTLAHLYEGSTYIDCYAADRGFRGDSGTFFDPYMQNCGTGKYGYLGDCTSCYLAGYYLTCYGDYASMAGCTAFGNDSTEDCFIDKCRFGDNSICLGKNFKGTIRDSICGNACIAGSTSASYTATMSGTVINVTAKGRSCGASLASTNRCTGKLINYTNLSNQNPIICDGAYLDGCIIKSTLTNQCTLRLGDSNTEIYKCTLISNGTGNSIASRTKSISAYATSDGGTKTQVTSTAHGLVEGLSITIDGTTGGEYEGTYTIEQIATDTFVIPTAFGTNPATKGSWYTNVNVVAAGNVMNTGLTTYVTNLAAPASADVAGNVVDSDIN